MIGVIGGMGIEAGQEFDRLLRLRGYETVRSDKEHPCRIAALEGRGPSPAYSIASVAIELALQGADRFVLACNTAHLFLDEIKQLVPGLEFIDMVALAGQTAPVGTVVFGTTAGLDNGLFPGLARPEAGEQDVIQQAIWGVKQGDYSLAPQVQRIANKYDRVLAGCTEVPLLLREAMDPAYLV